MGWNIEGQYVETCNCAFLCPCITSNLSAKPTEGDCKAALGMRIDSGEKDESQWIILCCLTALPRTHGRWQHQSWFDH